MRSIAMMMVVAALMGLAAPVMAAPVQVVVEGRAAPRQMAAAMTQVQAAVGGNIAPTPVEQALPHAEFRSEVLNHPHGGLWTVGTNHVGTCASVERFRVAEMVEDQREAETAIDELEYELAEALLEGLFKSFACLNEEVTLAVLWRHYVLSGIAVLGQGYGKVNGDRKPYEDKARALFVWAHRVLPGQPWDPDYPPQYQVPYEQANADLLRERLAGDRGRQPYDALVEVVGTPEGLTVNGGEVPSRLSPGSYLLQWSRESVVYSRVVTVEEEVGVTIRLVTQEGWLAALSAFPDRRTPAQAAVVEATVKWLAKRDIPGLAVLSFTGSVPVAMYYRLETGSSPTVIDIHLPEAVEDVGAGHAPPEGVVKMARQPRLALRPAGQLQIVSKSLYGGFSIAVEGHVAKDLWIAGFGTGGFTRWDGVPYGLATAGAMVSWHFHPVEWLEPFATVGGELEVEMPSVLGAVLFGGGAEVILHPQVRLRLEVQGGVGGQAGRANAGRFRVTLGPTFRMPEVTP